MRKQDLAKSLVFIGLLCLSTVAFPSAGNAFDIRGIWVGKAKGPIFGAEGTVTITRQEGEDISGIVEGGNFLGTARFPIQGKIRGNYIFGDKDGNVFEGLLYGDGTIRGAVKAIDGNTYRVFLRRPYPYWGMSPYGQW